MEVVFSEELRAWRGKMYLKEAAAKLDIPLGTYRKYEEGTRKPTRLGLVELKRRMGLK